MSSIDESQRELLRAFFEEHLKHRTPNPDRVFGREREDVDSYFVVRDEGLFPRERFELSFRDAEQIAASLNELWAGGPYAGLGVLLVELSRHFEHIEEREDVSSFVYEMF